MAVRRRRITDAKCRAACVAIAGLDVLIDRETTRRAWTDIMDIAVHYDLTTYDASYLELALRLSLPLAALDGRLREAAQKASVPLLGK